MNSIDPSRDEAIVHRTFRIERLPARGVEASLEALRAIAGVLTVQTIDGRRPGLRITYDVRQLDAGGLAGHLTRLGLRPINGLWQRLRLALYRLQDENIRENLAHRPSCCSRPPPGAGKGGSHSRH